MATENDSTPTAAPRIKRPVRSITGRVQHISASVDGAAAILQELVAHEDLEVSRQSFAVADLLERLSTELDQVAGLVETMETHHYDADA